MVSIDLLEPILLAGIILVGGYGASLFLERFGIPHIVVYLMTGFFIGNAFSFALRINFAEEM